MRNAGMNVLTALGLDDLRLLNVIGFERQILFRRFGGWRFVFRPSLAFSLSSALGASVTAAAFVSSVAGALSSLAELSAFAGFGLAAAFAGFFESFFSHCL